MDFELELGSVQKTLFVYNIHALIIYTKKFLHSDWSNFFHEVTLLWSKISLAGYGMGFKMKARCRVTKHLRRNTD